MQILNCVVRLSGDVTNESVKNGVTAPEVMLLQHLHGHDAVRSIQPTVMDKRGHREERARLIMTYGDRVVTELFGGPHLRLPIQLVDDLDDESDDDESEDKSDDDDGEGSPPAPPPPSDPKKTLSLNK